MTEHNPYLPSHVYASAEGLMASDQQTLGNIARETFLAWEKLRPIYVTIAASLTLGMAALLSGMTLLVEGEFWVQVIAAGMIANLFYFAGPILETYVRWLGLRTTLLCLVTFVLRTLVTCAGAAFHVLVMAVPFARE